MLPQSQNLPTFMPMLKSKVARRFLTTIVLFFLTLSVGVAGFHWIEGYNLLDATYMTVITMSTVGFGIAGKGDLSPDGKLFAIFLIIFTIGVFTYTISTLTTLIFEGEIRDILKGYRVNKEISKIRNHIVICGLGRNGKQAAIELMSEKVPFVVIEHSQTVIENFQSDFPDTLVLKGDATDEDLLALAGIQYAKGVITALADDAANVFATLSIRQLSPTVPIVARASNESTIKKLEIAGANKVILPNVLGGRQMAKVLTKPALMDFVDLVTGRGQFHLNLEMVECGNNPKLIGKSLLELNIRSKVGVLVLGLQDAQGNFQMNPDVNQPIKNEEKLFLIGTDEQIKNFTQAFT
jgi:voltage-gated potassium channel